MRKYDIKRHLRSIIEHRVFRTGGTFKSSTIRLHTKTYGHLLMLGYVELLEPDGRVTVTNAGHKLLTEKPATARENSRSYRERAKAAGFREVKMWVHETDENLYMEMKAALKRPGVHHGQH